MSTPYIVICSTKSAGKKMFDFRFDIYLRLTDDTQIINPTHNFSFDWVLWPALTWHWVKSNWFYSLLFFITKFLFFPILMAQIFQFGLFYIIFIYFQSIDFDSFFLLFSNTISSSSWFYCSFFVSLLWHYKRKKSAIIIDRHEFEPKQFLSHKLSFMSAVSDIVTT